ncbi:MAG: CPXCG motif-containing cysteine-rich protein [Verrucomicrobia bacterium]|jgi:hypothetical protein|nr:CPXCG motif-containing cysteine-rich protein [Verrucomicrobiota bacterium]
MDPHPECTVVCPTCHEAFTVAGPAPDELPVSWDYDCEVCCRPMWLDFHEEDGEVHAQAREAD